MTLLTLKKISISNEKRKPLLERESVTINNKKKEVMLLRNVANR